MFLFLFKLSLSYECYPKEDAVLTSPWGDRNFVEKSLLIRRDGETMTCVNMRAVSGSVVLLSAACSAVSAPQCAAVGPCRMSRISFMHSKRND